MGEAVRSYGEYREYIRVLLGRLDARNTLRFCAWCLDRFPQEFGEAVWDSLTEVERQRLADIVSEIQAAASAGEIPAAEQARELQAQLEAFGPHDEVAATEVHPDGTEFRSLLWNALEFCRTRELSSACAVSEGLINSWDYRVGPRDGYDLENMFIFPELQRELESQEQFVGQLSARTSRPTTG